MARIAFLSDGGIEKYAVTQRALMLGKCLVEDGHEVDLFLTEEKGDREKYGEKRYGIRLHYAGSSSKLGRIIEKYRLMKDYKFDFVHCLKPSWSFLSSILNKKRHPKHYLIVDHDELESNVVSFIINTRHRSHH